MKREDAMKLSVECPICQKVFKNIYSASAHKSHCLNPARRRFLVEKQKTSWRLGKTWVTDDRIKSKWSVENVFCEKSSAGRETIKKILFLENRGKFCEICNIDAWQGKSITLHLDHINGVRDDNRRENLRFLCPNCHSQTETYCKGTLEKLTRASDAELIDAMNNSISISAALSTLSRSGGRRIYARCVQLADEHKITHILESLAGVIDLSATKHARDKQKKVEKVRKAPKRTDRSEIELRRQLKRAKIDIEIQKVLNSQIDFTSFGWVQQVAVLLSKKPQKICNWMRKHMPDFYETKCFKRNISNQQ